MPSEQSGTESPHYAMFSGGHDSLVSTHYAMANGLADRVLHLDTGTGIPENEQFVRDVCDRHDWPLRIETPNKSLKEFALEWGFPGSAAHGWAYRYFKAHSLQRVAGSHDEKPHFYTGVRKSESERRMRTVDAETTEDATGRWWWHAPIAEWSKQDCYDYIDEHDLERNPVVENIHRSGECYCGAFAHRDEELLELQAHYPEHYEWLMEVEGEVQDEIGTDEAHCFWGADGMPPKEVRALIAEHDDAQMVLCQDCELVTDGGQE